MQKLIGKMARMYPLLIAMGFMVVVVAFVIGYFNSQTAAEYYSQTKVVRESSLMAQRAAIASTGLWLPYFKFLGIGLLLGGIVMALRVIIDHLRAVGSSVLEGLPDGMRPAPPKPPWYGLLMPVVMMLGLAILVIALILSLGLAGTARTVFAHPVSKIDVAGAGSTLLTQLRSIQTTSAGLVPFKFLGIATEFLAIAMGLGTIHFVLGAQTQLLNQAISIGQGLASLVKTDNRGRAHQVSGLRPQTHRP